MQGIIHWFEIPVSDFERACEFYSFLLGEPTQVISPPESPLKMGLLPGSDPKRLGGALVHGPNYVPSEHGTIIYLNGEAGIENMLQKVEKKGGRILLPKTGIGESGFVAHFLDCEGNRIALHSSN